MPPMQPTSSKAGADIPIWGGGMLSVDAIYSYVRDSVSIALAPGSNDANGNPIPPFLPQTLTATISDNSAVMVVGKYTQGPLRLFAGYEHMRYTAPSDSQIAFTDIAGSFLCQGCDTLNRTETSILHGAHEIMIPATVFLMSICIGFVPMFLLGGVAGYLFRPLAEAVVFALIAFYL